MISQTGAELLKIRSTRTTLGLMLGLLFLVLVIVLLTGLLSSVASLLTKEDQRTLFAIGALAGVFSGLAGVFLVTSEFRFGTIRPTFLFTPQRSRVLAAKLAASLLGGLIFGVASEGLALVVGYATIKGRGIPTALSAGEVLLLVLGTLIAVALWGAIGVGLGSIIRNQVGAVITLLAWVFVIDNLLFGLVPAVGRFTPTRAQDALMGLTTTHLLAPVAGGVVLLAWAVALAVAGFVLTARRDVN
ncbi:MAG: hypothetical protein WAL63_04405 [Solirubrobacteraceae bacterium]